MTARVLIVEDDAKIAALLRDYLSQAGYQVSLLERGDGVEAFVAREHPDLVLLDLQLPGKDGLAICRALRERGKGPAILMVTARVEEIDRLLGLELGADDYVCKPFSPREVVARVKAILRRGQTAEEEGSRLTLGPIDLEPSAHQVRVAGDPLALTPIEFRLLVTLLSQPRRVWSRAELLKRAGVSEFEGYERNIDSHVKNLRRKLKQRLAGRDAVRSVYGVGYGLAVDVLLEDGS